MKFGDNQQQPHNKFGNNKQQRHFKFGSNQQQRHNKLPYYNRFHKYFSHIFKPFFNKRFDPFGSVSLSFQREVLQD